MSRFERTVEFDVAGVKPEEGEVPDRGFQRIFERPIIRSRPHIERSLFGHAFSVKPVAKVDTGTCKQNDGDEESGEDIATHG